MDLTMYVQGDPTAVCEEETDKKTWYLISFFKEMYNLNERNHYFLTGRKQ